MLLGLLVLFLIWLEVGLPLRQVGLRRVRFQVA